MASLTQKKNATALMGTLSHFLCQSGRKSEKGSRETKIDNRKNLELLQQIDTLSHFTFDAANIVHQIGAIVCDKTRNASPEKQTAIEGNMQFFIGRS